MKNLLFLNEFIGLAPEHSVLAVSIKSNTDDEEKQNNFPKKRLNLV